MFNEFEESEIPELTPEFLDSLKKHFRKRYRPADKEIIRDYENRLINDMPEEQEPKPGRKVKTLNNVDIKERFNGIEYADMASMYPRIDDILHGVCRLDTGNNTRPLSKTLIFNIMANAEEITIGLIMHVCDVKKSQAYNYLKACRIASRMILNEFKRK
jgi:hypothetical protein